LEPRGKAGGLIFEDSKITRLPFYQKERYHLYLNLSAELSGQLLQPRVSGTAVSCQDFSFGTQVLPSLVKRRYNPPKNAD
jgi:hypothetical protein